MKLVDRIEVINQRLKRFTQGVELITDDFVDATGLIEKYAWVLQQNRERGVPSDVRAISSQIIEEAYVRHDQHESSFAVPLLVMLTDHLANHFDK